MEYQDIPRIYTAAAEWMSCILYLLLIRTKYPRPVFCAVSLCVFVCQSVLLVFTKDFNNILWIMVMILAILNMFFFICMAGRSSFLRAGYCCVHAFLLAELTASLIWQIQAYLVRNGIQWQGNYILLPVCGYLTLFFFAYRLEHPILTEEYLSQLTWHDLFVSIGIVSVIFIFSNLSFISNNTPFTGSQKTDIFNIRTLVDIGGAAILYALQAKNYKYLADRENAAIYAALKSQYEQYRNYQDNMQMIQIKYHDLKHQIAGLRSENEQEKRKVWIDALERELEDFDTVIKTGNSVLDAILGAKIVQAKKKDIKVTCVADGSLLNFMHVTDICTIFGNALDNALENVVLIEDPQKRLIHIGVFPQENFTFIRISNYCETEPELDKTKMPVTTKSDTRNHGFGLKSIRISTEKYGGSVTAGLTNNWFELCILLPKDESR